MRYLGGTGFSLAPLFGLSLLWVVVSSTTGIVNEWLYAALLLLLVPALVFSIAMHVGLTIRRSHDVGLSGLFAVLAYVPYVGMFYIIYLFVMRGNLKANQYGPAPHPRRDFMDDLINYDLHQLRGLIQFTTDHLFGVAFVAVGIPLLLAIIGRLFILSHVVF
jgi:uncharacterized membrane protein YhaH (DUF805 family)